MLRRVPVVESGIFLQPGAEADLKLKVCSYAHLGPFMSTVGSALRRYAPSAWRRMQRQAGGCANLHLP